MSTFSTEMKQMFKKWLHKLASSACGGTSCLKGTYSIWLLQTTPVRAVSYMGSRKHTPGMPWTGEENSIGELNYHRDFLTYNFCLERLRFNSSLMPTSFLLCVVVKPSFMDTQKFLEPFEMEAILWIYQCMYICLMRGLMQFCRILWNESKKR